MKKAVLLLKGGRSSRMGFDKASLKLNNQTLYEHMLDCCVSLEVPFFVLSRQNDTPLKNETMLQDQNAFLGPVPAIRRATETLKDYKRFLVMPIDMPFLKKEMLNVLLDSKQNVHYQNQVFPFCFDGHVHQDAKRVKDLLKGFLQIPYEKKDESLFLNINTLATYQKIAKK